MSGETDAEWTARWAWTADYDPLAGAADDLPDWDWPGAELDPYDDRPPVERLTPPADDGPSALEYRAAVAEQAAEHHPAVAAIIAAGLVDNRRRQRHRACHLRVVR